MSSRFREKSCKPETKKEFIVRVAKEDPFLKIEEIADQAKTTQRYVRTILSEANLSLMNLREKYARRMEKQSEAKILFSIKDSVSDFGFPIEKGTAPFTYGEPEQVVAGGADGVSWHDKDQPFYQYMQSVNCYGQTCGFIIYKSKFNFSEADFLQGPEGYQRLALRFTQARLTSPEIEIGRLSELLHNTEISSVFGNERSIIKIKTYIKEEGQILGEETFIFPSDFVKVTIPGLFSPELELAR